MKEYISRMEKTEKSEVRLVVKKTRENRDFSDVEIYVKCSHISGRYYIKYNLLYEYDPPIKSIKSQGVEEPLTYFNGSNGGYNRSNYRIRTAYIVRKADGGYENIYKILQDGEISLAIKEKNLILDRDSGDYVGGFHGDENIYIDDDGIAHAELSVDGMSIPIRADEDKEYFGASVEFVQKTLISRCNTPEEIILAHLQHYVFDKSGVRNKQRVITLTDDYEAGRYALDNDNTFLQMCTFYRVNAERIEEKICDGVNFYDSEKRLISKTSTEDFPYGAYGFCGTETKTQNCYVEYEGNGNGIYGLVGFKIVDDSVICNSAKVMIRTFGDNKWYSSFRSKNGQPKKNEEWKLDLLYYIDYDPEK